MKQEQRSRKTRRKISNAALRLFSHGGLGGSSVQDIADYAGISKANIYHHFPDKETIFRALLDDFFRTLSSPDFPVNRVLASGAFPENLEEIAFAVRAMVRDYREQIALVYVDVAELGAAHIRWFYEEMAARFTAFLEAEGEKSLQAKLADDLSPTTAVILATRIFLNYFVVEILFGVKEHYGKGTDDVIREITTVLRHGMLRKVVRPTHKPAGT
ncbi:MAG: hypothetical protein QOK37_3991 [Thermoanaerobaculia bacterium]|jgi:TetR/AcrR family transcriptional regulator|nr:hypothetical protein [Thermoanaerobaculia bacterium]